MVNSFGFIVVVSWSEWNFRNNGFEHFIANFQIDLCADGFEVVGHISHGNVATEAGTRAPACHLTDLLAVAEDLHTVSCRWPFFQTNTNASALTPILQLIQDDRCTGEVGFGSTSFCC